ncbi:MAG: S8 family serine peptidase, partial [Chloroflexi bacterium]|nr:S8 family serine peptidase [Chloroflexota bacterium]
MDQRQRRQGNTGNFEWKLDFLYIDRPNEGTVGVRDFGEGSGFVETDASYGEKLFIVDDYNNNGVFDSGDKLIPIWTSKFYAIYYLPDGQSVPIRRQRGLDLIRAARDTDGHGTNVAGVMASGRLEENKSTQNRTYIGMAPGADYIMGNWQKNADKEYEGVNLNKFQDWAQADGAKVMNYSWGFYLYWQFMDGSSAEEGRIDELANPQSGPGIPQVVSAGNEADLDAHFYRAATPRGQSVSATFNVPQGSGVKWVKQSVLWLSSKGSNVSIQVTRPGGLSQVIGVGSEVWQEVTLGTDRLRWR